jgi:cell division protein FtsI/penicillin-binding protein 2
MAPFVAAWAKERGLTMDPQGLSEVSIHSAVQIEGERLECLWPPPAGRWDLSAAFQSACPAPFAVMSESFTGQGLMEMVSAFGFDQPTGIQLAEAPAVGMTPPSGSAAVLEAALGQGDLTVTPLQMVRAWSSFFNEGNLPPVRLVESSEMPGGDWQAFASPVESRMVLSASTAAAAREWFMVAPGQYAMQAEAIAGESGERVGWIMLAISRPAGTITAVMGIEEENPSVVRAMWDDLVSILEAGVGP